MIIITYMCILYRLIRDWRAGPRPSLAIDIWRRAEKIPKGVVPFSVQKMKQKIQNSADALCCAVWETDLILVLCFISIAGLLVVVVMF